MILLSSILLLGCGILHCLDCLLFSHRSQPCSLLQLTTTTHDKSCSAFASSLFKLSRVLHLLYLTIASLDEFCYSCLAESLVLLRDSQQSPLLQPLQPILLRPRNLLQPRPRNARLRVDELLTPSTCLTRQALHQLDEQERDKRSLSRRHHLNLPLHNPHLESVGGEE